MKSLNTLFATAIITLLFSGCIETHVLLSLRTDGSGTIREEVKISSEVVVPLMELAHAMKSQGEEAGDADESPTMQMFTEKEIRERAKKFGAGVYYVMHEVTIDEKMHGYVAEYTFADINSLRLNSNPGDAMPAFPGEDEGIDHEEEDLVEFSFTRGETARLVIRPPAMQDKSGSEHADADSGVEIDAETGGEEEDAERMDELRGMFEDMRVSIIVEILGDVIKSNAMFRDGRRITILDIDFSILMENEDALKQLDSRQDLTPAQVKQLITRIPGIRFDPSDEIEVTFR
jgi:hypothetical protein